MKFPEKKEVIKDLIDIDTCINSDNNFTHNISESYNKVTKNLGFGKQRRLVPYKILKYVAAIILLVGLAYFYKMHFINDSGSLSIPEDSITLKLENGNIEVITASGNKKVIDINGKIVGILSGEKLSYQKKDVDIKKLVYNELRIPNGKTFQLELSDGTNVYLNAGTLLKYPVNFIKGKNRQVFLEGEAYFEVTKDTAHPFIVSANDIDIRVLGTKFNVNSYKESKYINTVLIEGSVAIYKENDTKNLTYLTPGHIASWSNLENSISIDKVDTKEYTAWIDGKLIFKRRTFAEILKVLERHFDIEIINNYDSLNSQRFLASFDTESIEQILEYFKKTNDFNFEIISNKIIINQP